MNNSISIYTAGPIDLAGTVIQWRDTLKAELESRKVRAVIFDPSRAFSCSKWGEPAPERAKYIETVNTEALFRADIFVAILPSKQFSMGVPIEIDLAQSVHGKPCFVITDIPFGKSAYLDNRIPADRFINVGSSWDATEVEIACTKLADMIAAEMDMGGAIETLLEKRMNKYNDTYETKREESKNG